MRCDYLGIGMKLKTCCTRYDRMFLPSNYSCLLCSMYPKHKDQGESVMYVSLSHLRGGLVPIHFSQQGFKMFSRCLTSHVGITVEQMKATNVFFSSKPMFKILFGWASTRDFPQWYSNKLIILARNSLHLCWFQIYTYSIQ